MKTFNDALSNFFGVAVRGQTYLNALYLLMAFPLGLFYFIFLVTGLSIGLGLVIVWVGLLLLLIVFGVWYALLAFERMMAISMLHEEIPPMTRENYSGMTIWQKLKSSLANPVTWKGLLYLLAKFPLGTLSFIVLVTLISVSASLVGAPLYYQFVNPQIDLDLGRIPWNQAWAIDTLPKALLASLAGIFVTLVSMHIFNGLAWVSGKFARIMLGNFSSQPTSSQSIETPAVQPTSSEPEIIQQ